MRRKNYHYSFLKLFSSSSMNSIEQMEINQKLISIQVVSAHHIIPAKEGNYNNWNFTESNE